MSKHTPRTARWARLDAKEYRSAFGVVRYRAGAWEGMVQYELLQEEGQGLLPSWHAETCPAGRFKRPRNAMMAVEDKAREISRRYGERVKIGFEE